MTANSQLELVGSDGVWTKRKYDHYIIEKDPLPDAERDLMVAIILPTLL